MNLAKLTHTINILLAEDSTSERLFIASLLELLQVEDCNIVLHQCIDGQQALSLCENQPIDLLISDWRMPKLTGIAVCEILKQTDSPPYILLLTGNNATDDLIYALESGADDYLAKPFEPKVLKMRVIAAIRLIKAQQIMKAQNNALNQAFHKTQKLLDQKKSELKQAAQLQHALLPDKRFTLENWQVNHYFAAANELAGDMFQCFTIDGQWIGFFLIDVSGHGAGAAMQSFALAQSLNPSRVDWHQSPAILMDYINQVFSDPCQHGQFATMIIGKINSKSGQYEMCNAGHPQPFLISQHRCESLDIPSSLPIGIDENTQYIDCQGHLADDEHLMIFSDGIYEINHPKLGMFGLERLKTLCMVNHAISGDAMIHRIRHALSMWQQGEAQDDMSLMLFSNRLWHQKKSVEHQKSHNQQSHQANKAVNSSGSISDKMP
ncbi:MULTISPECIES: SpoIIE family protein phosphatase [Shewanella]|uniref:Fused response regulator/phosphatase n=1 Tax=Shewanella psychromarinicola TaxID=2487742 RepID=A0A3N4DWR8_9GAMM|nr:SpoIIE family protein phosphatase [Shewanella psychromarinicola]AZG35704.1 fused response regulator/phosphatase [Shewanella psychromarinicola]MCL1081495.1 SpoIIE family protein phosphatase [Shewanella psychromarinicola]RPA30373.1 fused response regulator/phosphatase [Shewanella psychromarinicola]